VRVARPPRRPRFTSVSNPCCRLLLVTFANPLVGNVLGFCPLSEGPKAIGIDALVAAIDTSAAWLIYRGFRS
jgi:hypothetical protein